MRAYVLKSREQHANIAPTFDIDTVVLPTIFQDAVISTNLSHARCFLNIERVYHIIFNSKIRIGNIFNFSGCEIN